MFVYTHIHKENQNSFLQNVGIKPLQLKLKSVNDLKNLTAYSHRVLDANIVILASIKCTDVKERLEPYFYYPSGSSWPVLGHTANQW
jgi:abortive infection bacteriophage resistance protein